MGALAASILLYAEFSKQLRAELRNRFDIISAEIEKNGFSAAEYTKYNGEVVFFLADETSAEQAPEGIFDIRGAFDDDLSENDKIFGINDDRDNWYFYVGETSGSVLVVGTNLAYSSVFSGLVPKVFVTVGVVISIISVGIGLAANSRSQKKLNRISNVLGKISSGDLQRRVAVETDRDDLDDLIRDINSTLEHLEVLFNQTRNLAINIAHDLKTPLTRLRMRLENALMEEDLTTVVQNVEEAMKESDHIISVFEAFLRIARLETGTVKKRFTIVDLSEVANEVESIYAPVAEDAGFKLETSIKCCTKVKGDSVLLIQMLSNLIENSLNHTDRGTLISLVVDATGIGVADNGKGIPESAYDHVVKPSVRLDASRTNPGVGLGLALVKTIADVHEAKLELSENPWSAARGLYAFVRFH